MKPALAALLSLAGLALGQADVQAVCPTATRTIQNRSCRKTCAMSDCTFQTTIQNPCGCPATLPTATLIAPCDADCPYQGCDIDFRTAVLPCPTTPTSTRRWTTSSSSTSTVRRTTSTTTTPTGVVTSVITLPPKTTSTSILCPKVTRTTSPADCPAIRCPVPTCRLSTTMTVPCGCEPKTVLYVQGCQTECPGGCLVRSETVSLGC
ncbi:hypothetical protein C8A05DRAFT_34090 [Staphylotrichum tortipilum]|uniref:Uncharacterized protein n=1 Tax=Staphylotrichum tortipilum TaxID=2831512 RepID=A0AAN6RTI3_9PEZI|nr:hypothetical protein C8A05DRAFT_34090 [Staphylotrichum longicolle]